MFKRFCETLSSEQLIDSGDCIVIALSGGADSVALLHLFIRIRELYNITLRAIHVHHGIRGAEADSDADFTKELCHNYGVEINIDSVDVPAYKSKQGLSTEEAARQLRYDAFDRQIAELKKAGKRVKLAIAHNKDDNAETIFINLARGTGLKGLAGIDVCRGDIIRPLISTGRAEIESYLSRHNIPYIVDSTNLEDGYTRNRIRHMVIPYIKKYINSMAVDNIYKASRYIREVDEYMDEEARAFIEEYASFASDKVTVSVVELKATKHILSTYIIRQLIQRLTCSLKDISSVHIEDIVNLINMQTGKSIDLPYSIVAYRDYSSICIEKKTDKNIDIGGYTLDNHISVKCFDYEKNMKIPQDKYRKWFDAALIGDSYELRYRLRGDYISIGGGAHKSLKAYMIDVKIPSRLRDKLPLIAVGSHVVWLIGYRISEFYKISQDTKKVLEITYVGGEEND